MKKTGLNLGCGPIKSTSTEEINWVNIDRNEKVKPDLVVDFEEVKLPFQNNIVDMIYSSHLLEHIHNFIALMEEMYRVCKPGAKLDIRVPYGLSEDGIADPTHVRFLCPRTFEYFDRNSRYYGIYSFNCNFKVIEALNSGGEIFLTLEAVK